jgi:voltage-gated potassium channel
MNRLFGRKYQLLFVVLIALLVVYPLLRSAYTGRLLSDVLYTILFVAALLVIFTDRAFRLLALVLGIPTLLGAWVGYALPGLPQLPFFVGFHLVAAAFLGFAVTTILRTIFREKTISADSIYGAFCGYLLVGLIFGHLYRCLEALSPGSFNGNTDFMAHVQDERYTHFLLVYFSFVTLTTVGYGDITPASEATRGLAVVEAIIGQFYLAVLIGELIGKRVSQVLSDRQASPPNPPAPG